MASDGGPAFPRPIGEYKRAGAGEWSPAQKGMTLRDYFIAHAPAEPQEWFQPVMPPKPEAYPENTDVLTAWHNEQRKQRYIQWPRAWADAQLAERVKERNYGNE